MLHALVLTAQALIIFHWLEDFRAEQSIAFWLKGTIVNRLRLFDLSI